MGYTTDFSGSLTLSKELTVKQFNYINDFSGSRRMKRDVNVLMEVYKGKYGYPGVPETADPIEIYGIDGEFLALPYHQEGVGVVNHNTPPGQTTIMCENKNGQPGLWCNWIIDRDNELVWNGAEKFYYYVEWLQYLIDKFFSKWDVLLNGEIEWEGEDRDDLGMIVVKDNVIEIKHGRIIYE